MLSETHEFTEEQIKLIKNTIAKGATDDELSLFMATCKRTGLDPFSRQIYMIERRFKDKEGNWQKKMEIQASIDGLRVVAERTGLYQGQDGPYWCGPDGKWTDAWLQSYAPAASKIGVLKKGFAQPLWSVARWHSYAQTYQNGDPTHMWAKMGDVMLAKCAEALGLRRAFPNDLSGIYTGDEMQQAETVQVPSLGPQAQLPAPATPAENSQPKEIPGAKPKTQKSRPKITPKSDAGQNPESKPTGKIQSEDHFNPGDYVVQFGEKYGTKGKKISEIPETMLKKLLAWVDDDEKKGKNLHTTQKDYRQYAKDFLASMGCTVVTPPEPDDGPELPKDL